MTKPLFGFDDFDPTLGTQERRSSYGETRWFSSADPSSENLQEQEQAADTNTRKKDSKKVKEVRKRFHGDPTDFLMIHKWMMIQFYHLPSKGSYGKIFEPEVHFKAFVTNFEDRYTCDWNSENVYGRNDPIQTFNGTRRQIVLSWDVPAASLEEAVINMEKISALLSMLYPSYHEEGNVATIAAPPVFRVKFNNFITTPGSDPSAPAQYGGLMCTLSGFTFKPELSMGVFDLSSGRLIPKLYKLSTTMTILHDHSLGWKTTEEGIVLNESMEKFPYTFYSRDPDIRNDDGTIVRGTEDLKEIDDSRENEMLGTKPRYKK